MVEVNVSEAQERLPELIEAAKRGETVTIATEPDGGVFLTRFFGGKKQELLVFGSAKGEIWMSDDFDDPLPEFEEYMGQIEERKNVVNVSVSEAKEQLASLLAAAERGEEVLIASEDGAKAFQLIVSEQEQPRVWRRLGTARGMFTMSDDFDDPLPEFEEYMR